MNTINKPSQREIIIKEDKDFEKYKSIKKAFKGKEEIFNNIYLVEDFLILEKNELNNFFNPYPNLLEKGIEQYKKGVFRFDQKMRTIIPYNKKIPIFLSDTFDRNSDWTSQVEKIKIIASIDYVVLTSVVTLTNSELKELGYNNIQEAFLDLQKQNPTLKINSKGSYYSFKEAYTNLNYEQKTNLLK